MTARQFLIDESVRRIVESGSDEVGNIRVSEVLNGIIEDLGTRSESLNGWQRLTYGNASVKYWNGLELGGRPAKMLVKAVQKKVDEQLTRRKSERATICQTM